MGCICSSPHPPSPPPSPSSYPPDPIIRTTIGDSKGSTLFFNDQDFDRAILPKLGEVIRNTLLQPDGSLIVIVYIQLPAERPLPVNVPPPSIGWEYVVTKVESYYKFELQDTDRRVVARTVDLLEGDEVKLEYTGRGLEGVGSMPHFLISVHREIQPRPLLEIRGDPKEGTFLFTKGEFETHILPEMIDADRNTLSPDDGTLNVTIWYRSRELPFVLSKVEGDYKFEYVGSEGFAWRLDNLHVGDPVRLRYLNQAQFSLYKSLLL